MNRKSWFYIFVFGFILYGCTEEQKGTQTLQPGSSEEILHLAFINQQSNFQVQGKGIVNRLLTDDITGDKHQRFILELSSGQTLLIAHNIDLAARIDALQLFDDIEFYGEYEWNSEGGVIHWTHDDPDAIHENGWLRHNGIFYH